MSSLVVAAVFGACAGPAGPAGTNGTDGTNGTNGAAGTNGTNGTNGANGTNGTNGISAFARTRTEPAGTNCPNGGVAIEVGQDTNANGTLDPSEVTSTSYVCNAGPATLVRTDTESAGANCPLGGVAIRSGKDTNGDGVLQDSEVTNTKYVCGTQPVGTLIEGDVTITNSADLERFRYAARITGVLTITAARMRITSIDFPNLTSVGSFSFGNLPVLTTISLPALQELTLANTSIVANLVQLTTFSLPSLTKKAGVLFVVNNPLFNDCALRSLHPSLVNGGSTNLTVSLSGNGTALVDAGTCNPYASCWQVKPDSGVPLQSDGGLPDWFTDGGQQFTYTFCEQGVTGDQMVAACAALGANTKPVRFDTVAQMVTFNARAAQYWPGGGSVFIDGSDMLADGGATPDAGWYWSDGSPYTFYNWAAGEPNGANIENCLQFYLGNAQWNDLTCSSSLALTCQSP